MKKILILLFLSLHPKVMAQTLNAMTFNIRYNTENDKENRWDLRKDKAADMLKFYEVDICGMQEALIGQINDLKGFLPEYEYVGKGRDDGKEAGEFSPIFYRKDKFELLESKTLWLSLSPEVPSKGWDAILNRVVTYAKFKSKRGRKKFYVFNTHFDHRGEVARRESAKLLIETVKRIAQNSPVIIMGDFNATPEEEPFKILDLAFINSKKVSQIPHFGPTSSFNGFEFKEVEGREIDHIFINSNQIKVKKHGTLSNSWGGKFSSDHHAVLAVIEW